MNIIRNEKDYQIALERIEKLIDLNPELNTDLSDELESLCFLVERYEDKYYPMDFFKEIK